MPKISELTDSGAIQPGDSVPAVRSGSTVEVWPTVEQPASVSGTDTYTVNFGVDVSADDKVCGDFGNANTSATPTLENTGGTPGALTITTKDGSALWANALSGVHTFQLASGGGSWLLTDPNPSSQVDPIAYADTKLAAPGTSTDPGLAFDTWRTPNADRPTFVQSTLLAVTDGASNAIVDLEVDESGGTSADYMHRVFADQDAGGTVSVRGQVSAMIPAGAAYRVVNSADPAGSNGIDVIREFTL